MIAANAERGLPSEFVEDLDRYLPEVHFVHERTSSEDAVWLVGWSQSSLEHDAHATVSALRSEFPDAFLLVTARNLTAEQAAHLRQHGADQALTWKDSIAGVRRVLDSAFRSARSAKATTES